MFSFPHVTRYPGEGESAFEAFSEYLALGWDVRGDLPRRVARVSLDKLRRKYQPQLVEAWFRQFDWEERANLYDIAISTAVAGSIRQVCAASQSTLAAVVSLASGSLMREFERTLEHMRDKGSIVSLTDLVLAVERLAKTSGVLAPRDPDEGKTYGPNFGDLPEDQLIADELRRQDAAKQALQPGEPPIPGLTEPLPEDGF